MTRRIKVAALQMDANPAPVDERLDRAEKLVTLAAQDGAQLVVLPELFNTGYAYADTNFALAETIDGKTGSWMKAIAGRLNVHVAGSLLVLEKGEIYNSLLLFSPTGERWRYEKNYPWAWERGYFRERREISIAHTELGDFGMMLCWDVAHLNLWRQYAGQVDMIVAASCPPDVPNGSFHFADGSQINFNEFGPITDSIKTAGEKAFSEIVCQQARWLGVPAVNSGATGLVNTHVPKAGIFVAGFSLFVPRLIRQWKDADKMRMSSGLIPSCKVIDAHGQVITQRDPSEGDGYIMAEVNLQGHKPRPDTLQPKSPINKLSYWQADISIPWMMHSIYKNGKRQITQR